MKIPKLFKKAAAFVMAAVTALSIMPATAFAAGDIGTISFSHTYDSNGNAMRYNSSANIGGYTAGGTGNYKYRMFVDGENAFCIQPGVPLKTGNTLKKASSDTWNALSANQKKAVGLALLYGYQGNRNNLSGSDDEKWLATQTLVWEFVTGCREATGSYNQTSTTVYSLHFGSNYANSGARAVYDQIVAMLREHNTIPSFMSGGKNDITKELAYKDGKYSITLTDSNGVLSDYSFSSSDSNVSVSKSGNKLTISSTVAISGSVRITAKRNNVPTVSSSAKLIAYGDPNLQDLVTGVENADTVSAYINIETPTGTIALKKTSEDGVVEGISFTIKGNNFNKTVKTGKDGSVSVEGLFPGTYTVTEQSIDRYEPQKTQTVTLIGGKTSTVTFSNTLKRGSLEIVKTSEDNLVEGIKFHLYGTSLSGLPVDEYAVTDKNGLAKFENVLISGDTPYVVEEVDTAVRYVVPASQTAPIEWNKVTKRSFDNILKKFQVTVTKTDAETGSPQGDASLAGAVYGIYKGEELIDTYTTDENGQFTTKYYICDNDWTVREISPSEGYLLDTAIHKVGAEPELYTVELNSTENDVNEQVIKGNIALIKHGQHEGIISEELWQKVHAKRMATGIKQPSKIGKDRSHLLTGILKCPLCGSSMYTNKHAWTNKDGTYKEVYYYICGRNKQERGHHCDYKASLRKTDIEPLVIEAVKELVSDKYFAKEIEKRIGVQIDTTAIDKELANYERKLKEVDLNKARLEREIDNLPIDARFRERKIHDMTLRLDALYDTIVELEERIEDAKLRKSSIEMETITLDNIYKLMLNFGKLYDIISDEEKKSLITYLIKEIQIYPNGESEQPLKSIEFNFPIYRDGQEVRRLLWEKGNTVETVCLLCH